MALPENLFTPLSFWPTYGRTFQVFARAWGTFLLLTAFVIIPILAISIPVHLLVIKPAEENKTGTTFAIFVVTITIEFVLYISFALLGKGAMMQAVAEIYAGQPPNWLSCIKTTWHRLPTLLCFTLILGLIVFVTSMLAGGLYFAAYNNPDSIALLVFGIVVVMICAAWMIFVWVSVFMAMPSIMVEKESAVGSIQRSYGLSIGNRCYIFGTTFLLLAATFVVAFLLGPIGQIINIVLFPIHAILATVIYLNLRVSDGLDREMLASNLDMEPEIEVPVVGDKELENDII